MNLLKLKFTLSFVAIALLCGCASSNVSVYKSGGYSQINSWQVRLAYESGEVSSTLKEGKATEVKVARSGNSSTELTLREDLFYYLKDSKAVNVSANGNGVILISVDGEFKGGDIAGATVRLTDSKGEVISRLKIKNGPYESSTFKSTESFTRYIGDAIIDEISSKH